MIEQIKVGADIEVFLQSKISGEIISAEGFVQGTKKRPHPLDLSDPGFASSLDNVMAEVNIPPAQSKLEFTANIIKVLFLLRKSLGGRFDLLITPAAEISEKYLHTKNAMLFGCEPDYNAYTSLTNPAPGTHTGLRTCGGHVHVGYKEPNEFVSTSLVKAMDIFLGLPMVIVEPANKRKELYGKSGAYRLKPYGVEYRTLSNHYASDQRLMEWVYTQTLEAANFVNQGFIFNVDPADTEDIRNAIDNSDVELAKRIVNHYNITLP